MVLEALLAAVDAETLRSKGIDAYLEKGVKLDPAIKTMVLIERLPVPTTVKQSNRLLLCQCALSMSTVPQTLDLLSPLRMEFLPLSESEVSVPTEELQESETVEQMYQFLTEHLVKQVPVVQAQAA